MEADWRFRWILLCCLLASGRKWWLVNAELDGEDYVLEKENAVRAIVEQAVVNDAASCDLVSNCTASPCSRAACNMLKEDILNYQCVDVSQNSLCPDASGKSCNGVRVNYKRSYVRLPDFLNNPSSKSNERITAICVHRMLDTTFAALHNSTNGSYYNFYFGTVDGTFRFYPGTEVQECNSYDPRIRPWYIGAISVVKDLVVLVDVASSMNDKLGVFYDIETALAGAQSVTEQLLLTLTQGDRATVLSYSTPPSANPLGQLLVTDQVDASDPIFQQIQKLTVNASANVSNLTTGISQALQVFKNGSAVGALKIVLVLTNGKSPASEELYPLLQQLNASNIALFVYEIEDTDPTLAAVACQVKHGHIETVDISSLQNPLFAIKSYFTFLAQSRNLATPHQQAFWQLPYNDSNFRGEVITVAYPAISVDGQLIGVAGLDMQVGLISSALKPEITEFLRKNRIPGSPLTYQLGAPSVSPCPTVKAGSKLCNSAKAAAIAVCKQTDNVHNYTDLLCCPECGGVTIRVSHSSRLKWIIPAAAGGALAVGVVACLLWMWCRNPSRKSIKSYELDDNAPGAKSFESDLSGDTGLQSPGSPGRRI